jgi:hypothetical protein
MNKKTNTFLFILGATVFNVIVTVASFLILLILFLKFLAPILPQDAGAWGLPVVFVGAIAIAFILYRFVLKMLIKRIDVDRYFDPLFRPRKPPRKD